MMKKSDFLRPGPDCWIGEQRLSEGLKNDPGRKDRPEQIEQQPVGNDQAGALHQRIDECFQPLFGYLIARFEGQRDIVSVVPEKPYSLAEKAGSTFRQCRGWP